MGLAPQLERFVQDHANAGEPRVAVFDCDGTLIRGDIGESMFYYQLEHFLLRVSPAMLWPDHPKRQELTNLYESLSSLPPDRALKDRRFSALADLMLGWYFDQLGEGKTEKACSDIVRLFCGFSRSEARDIARATLKNEQGFSPGTWRLGSFELSRGIRYFNESIELLSVLRKEGFDLWVISGSNRWSVEAVCEPIGIHPDHVIGIDLIEGHAVLTSIVREPVPVLSGKVAALRSHVAAPPLLVASDSTYDIPLFNYSVGLKVLVHSNDDQDFFREGGISRDERWCVIDSPSYTG